MSIKLLERLKSEEFAAEVGFLLPSTALRRVLKRRPEVQEIEKALAEGRLVEDTIDAFVSSCMSELRRGERFPHDLALAALAAALEYRRTPFAKEYLADLSRLKLAEMSTSIRVARECLEQSRQQAETVISSCQAGRTSGSVVALMANTGLQNGANNTWVMAHCRVGRQAA